MSLVIVILEDCLERQAAMSACLTDCFQEYPVHFFESARPMIDYLESNLENTIVVALDHDLEIQMDEHGLAEDPGTGRDVADYVASRTPTCSVIIHSTNSPAAVGMEMALAEADWTTFRVVPYGDLEWIPEVWIQAVQQAITEVELPKH